MLRKIGLCLVAAACLWFGIGAIVSGLASDETKIRTRLEAACEGFGDARMNPILAFLARDFVDDTSGFHRDDVRAAVAGAFFGEKDPATKSFPYRAIVLPGTLSIDVVKPAATRAEVAFTIRITDRSGGGERTAWEFHVDGTMTKGDDGWQLSHATHQTASGNMRLR